jgi:hypothetical protein
VQRSGSTRLKEKFSVRIWGPVGESLPQAAIVNVNNKTAARVLT